MSTELATVKQWCWTKAFWISLVQSFRPGGGKRRFSTFPFQNDKNIIKAGYIFREGTVVGASGACNGKEEGEPVSALLQPSHI